MAGPDGNLWFTEMNGNSIGRITTGGVVTEFPVPRGNNPGGSTPYGIAAGPDDSLWFTVYSDSRIGRITTAGAITEFSTPTALSNPSGIARGSDGNMWFVEYAANQIGRITPAGVITEFPIPTASSYLSPGGIAAGPDGNLWFTEPGASRIGRITTSGVITEFPIAATPTEGIVAGPDGNLWFAEAAYPAPRTIGRFTTAGVLTEFPIPSPGYIGSIAVGPDGNLWFVEYNANNIGRITETGVVTEYPIPTRDSLPYGIAAGPDGNLWFTELNGVGRITTSPCASESTTLCLDNGRFAVSADWQAQSQGTSGHGTPVRLTANAGYFSFFSESNVEAVVKILNGCSGANGHYWVFAAGLTNVGVTLTVTDLQVNQTRVFTNPDGTAFQPIQDTTAFATCP